MPSPGTSTGGDGSSIGGTGSVVSVGSLVSVGVVGSSVVVVGLVVVGELVVVRAVVVRVVVVVEVPGLPKVGIDGPAEADVPAAVDGAALTVAGVVVTRADASRAGADRSAGSSLVEVAQPSAISDRVPDAVELTGPTLVAVATDALVVRSAPASGAVETTTAVKTATPSTALPAATVHQTRNGDRRLCRPLIARPPASTDPCAALPDPPHVTTTSELQLCH